MANPENLKGHEFTSDQSREAAAKNGRKGGLKSGENRRRRKAFAEAFEALLSREFTDQNGHKLQGVDAIAAKTFQAAMNGDLKAFAEIRNTVGEKPTERVEVGTIDPQARAEMDELLGLGD